MLSSRTLERVSVSQQIRAIDCQINAIDRRLRNLETIDPLSRESWQAAWDKHPELRAEEDELYRRRGELQLLRGKP